MFTLDVKQQYNNNCNLNTLWNIIMILHSYAEQVMTMCRVQEWQLSLLYFLSYFPLMISDAISCPLLNLNTLWNIIMILHSYIEQVMTMCRVKERQLSLSYFLSYLPLIVSDAILCRLHNLKTVWNILMILYSYVEQVMRMCHIQEQGRVAQSVGHLTRKSGVLGSIPGLATCFHFSFRLFKKDSCQLLAKVCARSTG